MWNLLPIDEDHRHPRSDRYHDTACVDVVCGILHLPRLCHRRRYLDAHAYSLWSNSGRSSRNLPPSLAVGHALLLHHLYGDWSALVLLYIAPLFVRQDGRFQLGGYETGEQGSGRKDAGSDEVFIRKYQETNSRSCWGGGCEGLTEQVE